MVTIHSLYELSNALCNGAIGNPIRIGIVPNESDFSFLQNAIFAAVPSSVK